MDIIEVCSQKAYDVFAGLDVNGGNKAYIQLARDNYRKVLMGCAVLYLVNHGRTDMAAEISEAYDKLFQEGLSFVDMTAIADTYAFVLNKDKDVTDVICFTGDFGIYVSEENIDQLDDDAGRYEMFIRPKLYEELEGLLTVDLPAAKL